MSAAASAAPADRKLPPIAEVGVGSMVLIIIGGIYLAAHIPGGAPVAPAAVLLVLSALVLIGDLVVMSRIPNFAWDTFKLVGGWALLAYVIIAGMLEYVFVNDGTRGSTLLVLTGSLLIFAVDVPLILAFSVARYQDTESPAG